MEPLLSHPLAAIVERLRHLCLAIPGASETMSHGVPAFEAEGRMFAYFRHDHHGDGKTVVCVKTSGREEQEMLIEADPELYSWPAYIGAAGWIAMSLAGPQTDWAHVNDRLTASHQLATRKARPSRQPIRP